MTDTRQSDSIQAETTVHAPAQAVWDAIATAEGLKRWFPIDARAEPGVGGSIWYSWGPGACEGTAKIVAWDPPRRLKVEYDGMSDDWTLEPAGNGTAARVVSAGFADSEAGREQAAAVERGWRFELAGLRHALERHAGKPRHVAFPRVSGLRLTRQEVWGKLVGPTCMGLGSRAGVPRPGSVVQFVTGARDRLEADLLIHDPPFELTALVYDWDDALVRLRVDPPMAGGDGLEASVFVALHGDRAAEARDIESRWGDLLRAALA